jgi:hypothetical protein
LEEDGDRVGAGVEGALAEAADFLREGSRGGVCDGILGEL